MTILSSRFAMSVTVIGLVLVGSLAGAGRAAAQGGVCVATGGEVWVDDANDEGAECTTSAQTSRAVAIGESSAFAAGDSTAIAVGNGNRSFSFDDSTSVVVGDDSWSRAEYDGTGVVHGDGSTAFGEYGGMAVTVGDESRAQATGCQAIAIGDGEKEIC